VPPDPPVGIEKALNIVDEEEHSTFEEENESENAKIRESRSLILSGPDSIDNELQSMEGSFKDAEDLDSSLEDLPFLGDDIQDDREELIEEELEAGDLISRARKLVFGYRSEK
jgi:hypothetical protein